MHKKRTAALGFIFVTLLVDIIGWGIIIPVLPDLIISLTHCNMSDASVYGVWLSAIYAGMQFVCSPILGGLSDRYGRRPVLLISLFGFGIDYLVLANAPTIIWLFIIRIFSGAAGASFTTASAYIADISPPEKRVQNFGVIGIAFGLGFMIGPAIGGILGHHFGIRMPFYFCAGLSLLNFFYGYFVLPESLNAEHHRKFEWKRANPIGTLIQLNKYPIVYGMIGSLVCMYLAMQATQSTWVYYTMFKFKWDEAMVGWSLACVGLCVSIVQGGLIRIINPWLGNKKSVYVGFILYVIGFALFAFASTTWMMFVFMIPYCLAGITGPALQGIMTGQVPANAQGELQGGLTSLISVTSIVGPLLMGYLFSYFTTPGHLNFPGAPFMMGAIFTLIGTILAMRSLSKTMPTVT